MTNPAIMVRGAGDFAYGVAVLDLDGATVVVTGDEPVHAIGYPIECAYVYDAQLFASIAGAQEQTARDAIWRQAKPMNQAALMGLASADAFRPIPTTP